MSLLSKRSCALVVGRLAFIVTALGACSDSTAPESPPPDRPPASGPVGTPTPAGTPIGEAVVVRIGPEGGAFSATDGRITVTVPAGAVSAATTFSVVPVQNHAHGALGTAYRLSPHGTTFAKPVRIAFRYDDATVRGTAPSLLRLATQNDAGYWRMYRRATVDAAQRLVSVESTHFSDWSLVAGAQLSPGSATVNVNQALDLRVLECGPEENAPADSLFVPIGYTCREGVAGIFSVKNWAVNGAAGGSGMAGTVAPKTGAAPGNAVYRAPSSMPAGNPVAVSVDYTHLDPANSGTLVANITVVDPAGACTQLRTVPTWEGTFGVSYDFQGTKPNSPDNTKLSHFAEVAARLTKFSEGPGGVTWQGPITGVVRVNSTTVEYSGNSATVTTVSSFGPPLTQPQLTDPSHVVLSVDLTRCTYNIGLVGSVAATVNVTNRAPSTIEASLGLVRTGPRPIGAGTNITGGGDFQAHSLIWALANDGDAYIFSAFSGDVILEGYASENSAGTARVAWAFDPVKP